jgi:hypothetical protein
MQAAVAVAVTGLILPVQVAQAVVGQAAQTLLVTQGLQTQVAGVAAQAATTHLTPVALAVQASLFCQSLLVIIPALQLAHPRSLQAVRTPLSSLLLVGVTRREGYL